MNIFNTKNNSTEDMIDKLQQLKGKTKLKFYKDISTYYDNMNIRFDDDLFATNAQGINKIYHEVLLLLNFYKLSHKLKKRILFIMIFIMLLLKIEKKKNL